MIRGIYAAAAGMMQESRRLEVTANNLANANTTGYKRDEVVTQSFHDLLLARLSDPAEQFSGKIPARVGPLGLGNFVSMVATRLQDGALEYTGRDLDVAVLGNAFFVVRTPQGLRYTRNGQFSQDAQGRLVSDGGWPVLVDGREAVASGAAMRIDAGGDVRAGDRYLGRLTVALADELGPLRKEGHNLYATDGMGSHVVPEPRLGADAREPYRLQVGYLETANVEPVLDMVALMTTLRSYEANQKALQLQDEALGKAVNEVARL